MRHALFASFALLLPVAAHATEVDLARVFDSPKGLVIGTASNLSRVKGEVRIVCAPDGKKVSCAGFDAAGKPVAAVSVTSVTGASVQFDCGDGVSHTIAVKSSLASVPALADATVVKSVFGS